MDVNAEILIIEETDFGPFLAEDGLVWSREDHFSENSGRPTMSKRLHTKLISSKAILQVTCMPVSSEDSRRLLKALKPGLLIVKFDSPEEGIITRRFLNKTPQIPLHRVYRNGKRMWGSLTFTLEEE